MLQQPDMSLSSGLNTATLRSPAGTTAMPSAGLAPPLPTSIGLTPPAPLGGGPASGSSSVLLPPSLPSASASGADSSPRIGLGQEEFRSAATWQNVLSNPSSNATTSVVREYGGKRRLASMHGKHLGLMGGRGIHGGSLF